MISFTWRSLTLFGDFPALNTNKYRWFRVEESPLNKFILKLSSSTLFLKYIDPSNNISKTLSENKITDKKSCQVHFNPHHGRGWCMVGGG